MNKLALLREELWSIGNPDKAVILQRFFKTGKGQYGEGDIFLGVSVPHSRILSKRYKDLEFEDIEKLLNSKIHEERLVALIILVQKFEKGADADKKKVFDFYLKSTKWINNWDLVDLSCPKIVGEYLLNKPKKILYKLAKSKNLWERRVSIVSTYRFIKNGQFEDTLKLSEILISDKHDLIHKAVGWMLREVGKKSTETLEYFLKKNYKMMTRTTLRYSIEKFPEQKRKEYLFGKVI